MLMKFSIIEWSVDRATCYASEVNALGFNQLA